MLGNEQRLTTNAKYANRYSDTCFFLNKKSIIFIEQQQCQNSEQLFKNAADRIVADGYKDVGYEYVIIDDCWMERERDPITKQLVPDRKRFPNGMKHLADYVSAARKSNDKSNRRKWDEFATIILV